MNEIRHENGFIIVNDRAFELSRIQDVRIMKEPRVHANTRWMLFFMANGLATIILGVLKGLGAFSGGADFINTLLLVISLGINCFALYMGIGDYERSTPSSIQMLVDGTYTDVLQSSDQKYIRDVAKRLKHELSKFQRQLDS